MRAVASTLIREISIACGAKEVRRCRRWSTVRPPVADPLHPSSAPQLSLYNAFREHDLSSLAEHDLQAHRTVKKLASEAEASLSSTNWDYAEVLALAAKTFVAHARKEERDLPVLLERLTDDESEAEARRYLAARRNAPERPHPLMPQSGGLLHRAADMRNRAHDKVVGGLHRRPPHVDLMFKHGA